MKNKRLFELEISPGGKEIYKDIEVGKRRGKLLKDCLSGKITGEEMRSRAGKYLYSSLPKNGVLKTKQN